MIGKISGRVDLIYQDRTIIDVNGVGYLIYCSAKTLANLTIGLNCSLLIEMHVREDHIHLYGFPSFDEQNTFILLQSVKGVGTRMALSILSHLSLDEIQTALIKRETAAFNSISGIGKKIAERIIIELQDKFITEVKSVNNNISNSGDAVSALVSLGILRVEAQKRVNNILKDNPNTSINDLIKLGLNRS